MPYIHQQFTVSVHYSNTGIRNGANKIITPLVQALNEFQRIPKYILVIPDKDMLVNLPHSTGISIIIGAMLHYVVKQIDILIEQRHLELTTLKPGALVSSEHPKIIWVRMLKRPKQLTSGTFSLRGKFNAILEERLLDGNCDNHFIMSIDVDAQDFDLSGYLTSAGKSTFWREVDRAMRRFDMGDIKLRPRQYKKPDLSNHSMGNMQPSRTIPSRKLPTPPPIKRKLKKSRSRLRSRNHWHCCSHSKSPSRKRFRSHSNSSTRRHHKNLN